MKACKCTWMNNAAELSKDAVKTMVETYIENSIQPELEKISQEHSWKFLLLKQQKPRTSIEYRQTKGNKIEHVFIFIQTSAAIMTQWKNNTFFPKKRAVCSIRWVFLVDAHDAHSADTCLLAWLTFLNLSSVYADLNKDPSQFGEAGRTSCTLWLSPPQGFDCSAQTWVIKSRYLHTFM